MRISYAGFARCAAKQPSKHYRLPSQRQGSVTQIERVAAFLRQLATILTALIIGAGCGTSHRTVGGQVFIVTQGRLNLKLGAVRVAAYPEEVIRKCIQDRETAFERELAAARANSERAKQEAQRVFEQAADSAGKFRQKVGPEYEEATRALEHARQAEAKAVAAARKADETYSQAHMTGLMAHASAGTEPAPVELAERDRLEVEADRLTEVVRELSAREARLAAQARRLGPNYVDPNVTEPILMTESYFSALPEPGFSATTDADGRFQVRIPRSGKYWLVASASRQTLDSEEHYWWIVPVGDDVGSGADRLLSNNNMLSDVGPVSGALFKH